MQPKQPNIVLIMADQLAPRFMGSYGNKHVSTPNLDKLSKESVQFDSVYTPFPLCCPARASLMTGRQASDVGGYDNATLLEADRPTVAHYLTNAGYECVLSGKMHFVGPDQLHGYKTRFTSNIYPADFSWTRGKRAADGEDYGDFIPHLAPTYVKADSDNPLGVEPRRWGKYLEFDDQTHTRALRYIRKNRREVRDSDRGEETKPFFLTVSYHNPHNPFHVPKEYWDMYEGVDIPIPEIPEDLERYQSQLDKWIMANHGVNKYDIKDPENLRLAHRGYCSLMTYIDDCVGDLLNELEKQGLAENTVVIFTSDHGEMLGSRSMVQKWCLYDYSVLVPLILKFPDRLGAGKRIETPVSLIDILPTCTDIAGYPADLMEPVDGRSLLPYIDDDSVGKDRIIFSESHAGRGAMAPCFMARQGKYKYIYIHGYEGQLFDLETDPEEWNNLIGREEYKEIEEGLKSAVLERFDPDKIEADIKKSTKARLIIDAAMKLNGTSWDYTVCEDGRNQFVRQKAINPEGLKYVLDKIWFEKMKDGEREKITDKRLIINDN
ncbi:MAG: sulfatase-like hydrolase/transferase [candidate division Zixibacteria bacterium]|nr:sulfatase-like hydrolase/transferase [candidate division Zixibacteria bacterium]